MTFLLRSIAPIFLVVFLPALAHAATYNLPSQPPPGCSTAGSVVSCSNWVTFGSDMVITVSSPVTLNLNGRGAIQGAQINVGGAASNLTINVNGGLNLGSNSRIVANLNASEIYGSGANNVRLTGAITLTGQLQLGSGAEINGSVTANGFSTGSNSVINGPLDLQGSFSPGNGTQVHGSINASSIQASGTNNVSIEGDITVTGQVQLGSGAEINGTVSANTFSTGSNSVINGPLDLQGSFSPGNGTQVHGSISASTIQASGANNVTIEGDVTLSGQLALGSQSQISGNIVAGSLDTGQNNLITGDVSVTGTLGLGAGSTIDGNVSGNLINIFNQSSVTGTVQSNGNVNLSSGASVGPITAGGSLSAGTNTTINGGIDVGGQVTLGEYSVVHGGVQAENQVSIHDDVVIHGEVATNGQVTVNEDVTIYGGVTAGTNIQIHNRSHIHGDLIGHDIHIFLDAIIEGSVDAQGVVTNAGVIQGNINAKGDVWLNGDGLCLVEIDGRLVPEQPGRGGSQGCVKGYVNAPNEHLIPPENVGGLICDQNVNVGPCTGSGGPMVTMYRIINATGTALTCEPLELTVFSCADPNCLTGNPITGDVTLSATDGTQVYTATGSFADDVQASVEMPISTTGTYTLALTSAPELAADPFQCEGPQGCTVTTVDAMLRWNDIAHRTAGIPFAMELEAIRADDQSPGACVPALQGVTSLDVSVQCLDPGTCSSDGLTFSDIAGSGIAQWPASASVPVSFDSTGRAELVMNYEDAGRIRLHALASVPGSAIAGWSDDFVVTPHHVAIGLDNALVYHPGVLARAGDELTVTLTAQSATNRITRNFGSESNPEFLTLQPQGEAVVPVGGADGLITVLGDGIERVQGGVFSGTIQYSEAGTARFRARIASQSYLGSTQSATGVAEFGRFLPWEFRIEPVQTSVSMTCSAPQIPFTYQGEPFDVSLQVSARNRAGQVTQNYPDIEDAGAWATLVARGTHSTQSVDLSDRLYKHNEDASLEAMPMPVTWSSGAPGYGMVHEDVVLERLPFDWDNSDSAGPFEQVILGVKVRDNEPGGPFVPLAGTDFNAASDDCALDDSCNAVTLADDLRFVHGIIVLTDTYGSEFSDLPVTLQVHYWDGERFRLHQEDQCSVVVGESFSTVGVDPDDSGAPQPEGPAAPGVNVINGTAPHNSLRLTAPGTPREVRFTYEAPAWLMPFWLESDGPTERWPEARAIFGSYGGHDRVLHWRLIH